MWRKNLAAIIGGNIREPANLFGIETGGSKKINLHNSCLFRNMLISFVGMAR